MAVNVSVYDLQQEQNATSPGDSKTVAVDIKQVVPIGYEGDEQWVVTVTTSAYSIDFSYPFGDGSYTDRLAIDDVYILAEKAGWAKSSGLIDLTKFDFYAGNNTLNIKIDGDTSWRSVTIPTGSGVSGDWTADELEDGIREIAQNGGADEGNLGYLNASVVYEDGRFKIVSGSVAEEYADTSVLVEATSNMAQYLGFDKGISSYLLSQSAYEPKESTVAAGGYTTPTIYVDLASSLEWSTGDAFVITEGGDSPTYEYFIGVSGTSTRIYVQSLDNTYLDSNYDPGDKIQKLRYQDPEAIPTPWHQDVDSIVRWGIKTVANQIDFGQ